MLESSFNKGSFIANDRKLYDVEKEPELFFYGRNSPHTQIKSSNKKN